MHTITCPNCGMKIDINKTIYSEIEAEAKAKLQQEIEREKRVYQERFKELEAKQKEIEIEKELLGKRAEAKAQELLQQALIQERKKIKEELTSQQNALIEELQKELSEKSKQLQELSAAKLTIEKLKREKEEIAQKAKLEAQKMINEELAKEREKIAQMIAAEHELKLKEKEKQLADLKAKLEEAQRKADLTSQQLQGEVQELAIEEYLRDTFKFDTIEEIKKGQRGADCVQVVHTRTHTNCGKIYYESKRTKEFQKSWIEKLKTDMRELGADIGVIVTQALPKGMQRMGIIDGVWVCTFEEFKALAPILRHHLIAIAETAQANENRSDKMNLLYNYLTSNEFKMQIEAIVEGFMQMQEDLDKERRAMQRIWKQREKQIQKVLDNTIALYGSIKGIAGNAIGHIEALQLPYSGVEAD